MPIGVKAYILALYENKNDEGGLSDVHTICFFPCFQKSCVLVELWTIVVN